MEVRLHVVNEKASAKQVRLGLETLIGRNSECNLRIASGQVSRRHCVIRIAGSSVFVRDLASANGTLLNGEKIIPETDIPVEAGSTLVVGPLKFTLKFTPPPPKVPLRETPDAGIETVDADELRGMAARPREEGETKDYLPARRIHADHAEDAPAAGDEDMDKSTAPGIKKRSVPAKQPPPVPEDTVHDAALPELARESARRAQESEDPESVLGAETELVYEEEDLVLLEPVDKSGVAPAVAPHIDSPPPEPQAPLPESDTSAKGWGFLKLFKRKKEGASKAVDPMAAPPREPVGPPPATLPVQPTTPPAADDSAIDPALEDFLKKF